MMLTLPVGLQSWTAGAPLDQEPEAAWNPQATPPLGGSIQGPAAEQSYCLQVGLAG